jgi:hypothetical protein
LHSNVDEFCIDARFAKFDERKLVNERNVTQFLVYFGILCEEELDLLNSLNHHFGWESAVHPGIELHVILLALLET